MDEFEQRSFQVTSVFSPSSPIKSVDLFSGREHILDRVIDAIFSSGQHCIIYGERGVGKTSLANILEDVLTPRSTSRMAFSRVNCEGEDTFSGVWLKILDRIKFTNEQEGVGFINEKKQQIVTLKETLLGKKDRVSADDIRKLEDVKGIRFIFIFDEFDRINKDAHRPFADTIKMLADYSVDATIILIGVADSVDDLLQEHASIDRSLVQILMPRMKKNELEKIIDSSIHKLEMTIELGARSKIVHLSQGLPHYTHLIGASSTRRALRQKRYNILIEDVKEGINAAMTDAQQSIINNYNKAITSHRKDNLFKQVLLACALCRVDDLGYFAPGDVKAPLGKIMNRNFEIGAFIRHLNEFCLTDRGPMLSRVGDKRRYRFRFNNPLLQPYVVMRGISEGLVKQDFISWDDDNKT